MAGELLMTVSRDEREQAIFRSRRMAQTDLESNYAAERNMGRAEGRIEGRIEGLAEGEAKRALDIARKMLLSGFSIDQITNLTDVTPEQLA